jgi:predicted DNA-binding protein
MWHHDAMRTIVELPDDAVEALDRLRHATGRSRAALVREAVERYLDSHEGADRAAAFGAWRDLELDGLALQRRLRSEWDDG